MRNKKILHKRFTDAVLAKKINLTAAQNNAVIMFFGVESFENLITIRSLNLYKTGEEIVNKTLKKGTENV